MQLDDVEMVHEHPQAGVAAFIEQRFLEWGSAPRILEEVFTDRSPHHIAGAIEAFCEYSLGARVARPVFFQASIGSVLGLELHDGRRIVVKVHRPDTSVACLESIQRVQRTLAGEGFPCPTPLVPPRRLDRGIAVAETLLGSGEVADAHDPVIRRLMAGGLARLVELCRKLTKLDGLGKGKAEPPEGRLWASPHDRRFDFEATTPDAEWIDRIAVQAGRIRDSGDGGELVVGHTEWRTEHMRFHNDSLSAVYDWDSLSLEHEPALVGSAAHAFTANWAAAELRQLPTLDEALAFVADYEAARGARFTDSQQQVVRAALTYSMAYMARCEHSDLLTGFGGRARLPTETAPVFPGTARAFLAAHAGELLNPAVRPLLRLPWPV